MSRLTGRLSMAGDDGNEDGRNKRMMSGMLAHLNGGSRSGTSGGPRNVVSPRRDADRAETNRDADRRITRSQASTGNISRGGYRGSGGGGRGGYNSSRNAQDRGHEERFQGRQERSDVGVEKNPPKKHTQKIEDEESAEELLDVQDIIDQISELSFKSTRSAAQIKRNIDNSNECLELMTEKEWIELCKSLIDSALKRGEEAFVVDLCTTLMKNAQFCETMSEELHNVSSEQLMKIEESNVPVFFANILCANWPRQYSKAMESVNKVLYTTACIIKGWIEVVDDDTEVFHKKEKKPAYRPIGAFEEPEKSDDEEQKPENGEQEVEQPSQTHIEPVAPVIVNKCAIALCILCETAQRQLWMKCPTTCDEIYQCFKPAIAYNSNLSGETKARLLANYLSINNWTRTRSANTKNSQTQTCSE